MAKLMFYRQKRYDGGIRMGVDLNGEEIAHHFEEGSAERDPALIWYADLRCEGPGLPNDPDDAMDWLLAHSPSIRVGFARFAEKLRVGADTDIYSLYWTEFPEVPEGVTMTIACSAARQVDGREMSSVLTEISERWDELLLELDIPESVEEIR